MGDKGQVQPKLGGQRSCVKSIMKPNDVAKPFIGHQERMGMPLKIRITQDGTSKDNIEGPRCLGVRAHVIN